MICRLNRNSKTAHKNSSARIRPNGRAAAFTLAITAAAVCLAVGSGWATAANAKEHIYVGVKKCKTCHKKEAIGNQYGAWLDGKHSKAFESLATDDAAKWAAEAGVDDPQTDEKCVKCHVTAYGVPAARLAKSFKLENGVQCEACHGAGKDYRKKKVMIDQDLAISKGLIYPPEEKDCRACHNDDSPAWDLERYTLENGTKVGFDFELASKAIEHPVPEDYDPKADKDDDE